MLKRYEDRRHWKRLGQPPSGGCVLKRLHRPNGGHKPHTAAFRRLCVETLAYPKARERDKAQPPSGGCVLKRQCLRRQGDRTGQPPSGGCVLKLYFIANPFHYKNQPPSGGCVLKHFDLDGSASDNDPAAFRRLCVETTTGGTKTGGVKPAAFRRLCVETLAKVWAKMNKAPSRLQAAVC